MQKGKEKMETEKKGIGGRREIEAVRRAEGSWRSVGKGNWKVQGELGRRKKRRNEYKELEKWHGVHSYVTVVFFFCELPL